MSSKKRPMQPRFNFMWFWALVIVVIIGFSLFGESEPRPIDGDWNMVDELVEKGYVERIEVKDREIASLYLHPEASELLANSDERFKGVPQSGAQVV